MITSHSARQSLTGTRHSQISSYRAHAQARLFHSLQPLPSSRTATSPSTSTSTPYKVPAAETYALATPAATTNTSLAQVYAPPGPSGSPGIRIDRAIRRHTRQLSEQLNFGKQRASEERQRQPSETRGLLGKAGNRSEGETMEGSVEGEGFEGVDFDDNRI